MFKEKATQKLIEYIQTFPKHERQVIAEQILSPKPKKNATEKASGKQKVLNDIKSGLIEIKEAKHTGKKLKTLDTLLSKEDMGLAQAMKKGRTGEYVNTNDYLKKLKTK